MPVQVINGVGTAGIRNPNASSQQIDSDAQLFISAATLTDSTHINTINTLVKDFKSAGLWTKMKSVYPMVGGTASSHKWNLKDPRDLDAAFRLVFYGGWTHSSTGAKPNGSTGYADTRLIPYSGHIQASNNHFTIYLRDIGNGGTVAADLMCDGRHTGDGTFGLYGATERQYASGNLPPAQLGGTGIYQTWSDNVKPRTGYQYGNTTGLFGMSRESTAGYSVTRNSIAETLYYFAGGAWQFYTNGYYSVYNVTYRYVFRPSEPVRLGSAIGTAYSARQNAFTTIGDGLTTTEMKFLYRIIEKFQNTLGRSLEPSRSFYYDDTYSTEVNDFLYSANISSPTQKSAINTLVNTLKTEGIWTKMKAIYPMVGGTSTGHSVNLKTPGTYDLTFNGGWTHSSSGATPNGSNAYANTNIIPSSVLTLNSTHLSYYSRTNVNTVSNEIGCWDGSGLHYTFLGIRRSDLSNRTYSIIQNTSSSSYPSFIDDNSLGFYIAGRTSSTLSTIYKNGANRGTNNLTSSGNPSTRSIWLGAANGNILNYSSKQCAFASIGDGLTDAEALAFYNAVQTFQTSLGRQV
jgi:hypothetical protein